MCSVVFGWSCADDNAEGVIGKFLVYTLRWIPWRCAFTFILVTYFMGGITMGLLLATDNTGIYTTVGIYTGDMKAVMLAVFIWLGYITALRIIKIVKDKKLYMEHSYEACIVFDDQKFQVKAFFDTGNRLKDPITGRPVAVASDHIWRCMQYRKLADFRFAMIPYETVGSKGMMEAIRTDYIEIGGRQIKGCFVAKGDGSFAVSGRRCAGQDYDLLISAEMVNCRISNIGSPGNRQIP